MAEVEKIVQQIQENLTESANAAATNGTAKIPSTPEGMALAYGTLVVMAMLPIFFGSMRSVKHHKDQTVSVFRLLAQKNTNITFVFSYRPHFRKLVKSLIR